MIHILICAEDPVFTKQLQGEIKAVLREPCRIQICKTAEELKKECSDHNPQILFMDVAMHSDEGNGIALIQHLFPATSGTAVIFIASYTKFCSDVYEADHVYTLAKPVQRINLEKALNKAIQFNRKKSSFFTVKFNDTTRKIDLNDVLYMESFYRKIRIKMWNESVECYGSFRGFPQFVQDHMIPSHKSFMVNPDYIRAINQHKFVLENGDTVPISRNHYNACRDRFLDYFQ